MELVYLACRDGLRHLVEVSTRLDLINYLTPYQIDIPSHCIVTSRHCATMTSWHCASSAVRNNWYYNHRRPEPSQSSTTSSRTSRRSSSKPLQFPANWATDTPAFRRYVRAFAERTADFQKLPKIVDYITRQARVNPDIAIKSIEGNNNMNNMSSGSAPAASNSNQPSQNQNQNLELLKPYW